MLVVEEELGQRAGQLGLADARRSEEEEGADRPVRVREPRARAADRVGDRADRFVLADDAAVQELFHADQLVDFALHELGDRDARPAADDVGDVLGVDLFFQERAVRLQLVELAR